MSIGLVQNARDPEMIELCGSRRDEWPYVWGTIHYDGIGDAIEGELLDNDGYRFTEIVECVIVKTSEWNRLTATVDRLEADNEMLEQQIMHLEQELGDRD